jgi:hypothetical protein
MMKRHALIIALASTGLFACATTSENGTLSELQQVRPDVKDVYLEDSLERAAQSYRRYLEETSESARTPEAMRRLADLQVEQAYGVLGSGEIVEMAAPDAASEIETIATASSAPKHSEATESELEFSSASRANPFRLGRAKQSRPTRRFSRRIQTMSAMTRSCTRCRGLMMK